MRGALGVRGQAASRPLRGRRQQMMTTLPATPLRMSGQTATQVGQCQPSAVCGRQQQLSCAHFLLSSQAQCAKAWTSHAAQRLGASAARARVI